MKQYSQNNEEQIILDYFKNAFSGKVLDIGANDGLTFSNSRRVIEHGWCGVLVEASPKAFSKLVQLYAKEKFEVHCFNVAVSDEEGIFEFWESGAHLRSGDVGLLSTLSRAELARWKRSGEEFSPITVDCLTYEQLISQSPVKAFDLITIDIEGKDYDVLRQIDLTPTSMVIIEVNQRKEDEQRVTAYCERYGLRLFERNTENLIFAR